MGRNRTLLALCVGANLACTGVVDTGGPEGMGAAPPVPSGGGNGGTGGAAGVDPGSKLMHRLNTAEYNNTVSDVLGSALAPANELWAREADQGFDNIASAMHVDDKQFQRYFEAAGLIADDVFANPTLKANVVTCGAPDDAACVQSIVEAVGLRLWRRPLSAEDVATHAKIYAAARQLGEDHDLAIKAVLQALLSSAQFLYRIEIDPDPSSLTPHPLGAYELASRASYFLWNSAPDAELLQAAADGTILDDAAFDAIFERMFTDPKADRFARSFVGQWLGVRHVPKHGVKAEVFPTWSPELASAMAEEVYQYFGEFLWGERSYLDFLKADVNYVDENLAAFYGITVPGPGLHRVEETSDQRFGFLGMGAFLAMSSYEYRTAPTLRGRWILINLLCTPPKDPPGEVPELDPDPNSPDAAEQNVRERLEQHRLDPSCAGCHASLDPYGLALENFDAIGGYRTAYKNGAPIDARTKTDDGLEFEGLQGLVDVMSEKTELTSCVTQRLFTYGLGRGVVATDQPYLDAVRQQWLAGTPTLKSLVRHLMLADTFRMRRAQ